MNVVVLYGPPAVGKLTVARALSKLTGYRLLHNHLLLDLSLSLFEKGTPLGVQLSHDLRHIVVERAIEFGLPGMILTWVYAPERAAYAEWFYRFVEERGGQVYFVRLYCDEATLEQRVGRAERREFNKLTRVEDLRVKLEALVDPFAEVSTRRGLVISTQTLSPSEAASAINTALKLSTENPTGPSNT